MYYRTITPDDAEFPARLKLIADPPDHLDVVGKILPEDDLALAVVGARKFTDYGREVVTTLVGELVTAGLTIVSGLARGIDSLAHETALKHGGRTVAVLGSGINVIFPRENEGLYKKIAQSGAVVSEFDPEQRPANYTFPRRNRLVSGMSLGVLVVEGAEKSGTLITARAALDQGREVFAVPGSIFSPMSVAPNQLIQKGAYPVTSGQEILALLGVQEKSSRQQGITKKLPESQEEKTLWQLLEGGPKHIDALVRESGLSAATVGSVLTLMEIKGFVRNMGAQEFRRV